MTKQIKFKKKDRWFIYIFIALTGYGLYDVKTAKRNMEGNALRLKLQTVSAEQKESRK